MATIFAAGTQLVPLPLTPPFPPPSSNRSSSVAARPSLPVISCSSTSQNPSTPSSKPNPNTPSNKLSVPLNSPLALTAVVVGSGFLIHRFANGGFGNFGGGGGGGGGGGSGGSGGGGFWSRLVSFFAPKTKAEESQPEEWDPHGLSDNVELDIKELSEFKKYKVSDVTLIDDLTSKSIVSDDPFNEVFTIKPGDIYTKSQMQEKREEFANCGMFEKVDFGSKTKPDGTIGIKVSFVENNWSASDKFKCINVGLMDPLESRTRDKDDSWEMNMKNLVAHMREKWNYKKRIDRSRPCLLPDTTHREILDMIAGEGQLSARLLKKVRDKVHRWYEDNGYMCAQVINFGNLNGREVVCEVMEGDITQVVVQIQDQLGNAVCEEKPQYEVVRGEFRKCLWQGKVFNAEEAKQAMDNVNSLDLFSEIQVKPIPDDKNEGGVVVEIMLKELEQQLPS
ncbi:Translocon at the outer envelope membrane ofs protein 75-III [Heracleum sosnowskyi]|uniref:Translocon at the outer envelope membrane ofs protein 75-III n=1 Tax=Heracleum sosnowskyi TaxID=360622 RepID=A0AAD8GXM5_9APIA|nr:Translocon at the outer envelope membrane ofs protein 75-III [Heracleum sosnowskyi]